MLDSQHADLSVHRSGTIFIIAGSSPLGSAWLEYLNEELDDDGVFACSPEQAKEIAALAGKAGLTVREV